MCGPSTYWQNGSVLLLPHSWKMKKKQFHQNTVVLIKDTPIPTAGFHHKQDHSHSLVLISVTKASKPSSDMWNLSSNHVKPDKAFFQFPKSSTTNAQIFYHKEPWKLLSLPSDLWFSKWWLWTLLSSGMWHCVWKCGTDISRGSCCLHHHGTLRMVAAGPANRLQRLTSH